MLFVGGAVGFEMLEGRHDDPCGEQNLTYRAYVTIEESLEMAGAIVFNHAQLHYIDQYVADGQDRDCTPAHAAAPAQPVQAPNCGNPDCAARPGSDAVITIRLEPFSARTAEGEKKPAGWWWMQSRADSSQPSLPGFREKSRVFA